MWNRPLTLEEWVMRLPEIHPARSEYVCLRGEIDKLLEQRDALLEEIQKA